MNLWPGYYDVAILPPAPVREYAIALSRRLRRAGGRWTLGARAFLPHVSLYHIPVRGEHLQAFLEDVQDVTASAELGELRTTGFDMPVLMVDKPDWLRKLHRRIVLRTVQYFDWTYGAE